MITGRETETNFVCPYCNPDFIIGFYISPQYAEYLLEIHNKNHIKEELNDELKVALDDNNLQIKNTGGLEKEIVDLGDKLYRRNKRVEVLEQQLDNVKFLNREEVEQILEDFKNRIVSVEETFNNPNCKAVNYDFTIQTLVKNYVTAICSLAKPITKDKIIKVLKKRFRTWSMPRRFDVNNFVDYIEQIANEILNNKSDKEE